MSGDWRLLDSGPLPAAENMALQEVVLHCRSQEQVPNTMRFLQMKPHAVLVGYHQSIALEAEEAYCWLHGIDINRRITGGGNLYYDESQLGWEIYALMNTPGIPRKLEDLYRLMCESLVYGLDKLGVAACYRPKNDIEVNGRKISGTGGTEFGNAFMYCGSLLTDFDVDTMINCLKLPVAKLENKAVQSFKERVTCLKDVLGYVPPMDDIKQALVEGFQEVLGINLQPGSLSTAEQQLLDQRLPFFQSEEWIYGTRPHQENELKVVDYKAAGGLIRVSARIDSGRQVIKSVFITGDFFAYPERSILDLEAALKNSPSRLEDLRENIQAFFITNEVRIPSMGWEDFYRAIRLAIERADENDAVGGAFNE